MNRWHLVMVMGWMVGCVAPSKQIGATVADTEGGSGESGATDSESEGTDTSSASGMSASTTTVGPETMTSNGEVTSVGPDDTTTDGEDTTTVGPDTEGELDACDQAQTDRQCNSFSDDKDAFFTCEWSPTIVVAGGGCEPIPDDSFNGSCIQTEQADSCGTLEDSTCPDGVTIVYFAQLGLEIGAVELLALETGVCSEATAGFEPCVMIDDGENITFEPPECACLCPS